MAKAIMIQGTMSNAGKSLLAAGLCRIFSKDGFRVAPFKSQNMALNSFITEEGLEMGRAQVVQAEAAGIKPTADMNPILLKPSSDIGSQVIVRGKPIGHMGAREYFKYKKQLIPELLSAYKRLDQEYDIIVIEGAGSPAEINLKQDDIVNMGMARMAHAPVLLAGDIDRGGVFAQLYGTVMLLEPEERSLIKGMIINKFRGDKSILDPGVSMIEELCKIPVVGVTPYLHVDLEDEDSLSGSLEKQSMGDGLVEIAIIRFPRMSNFTDFQVFSCISGVNVAYITHPAQASNPDMIILPGTKNTVEDLKWMRQSGLEAFVQKAASKGTPIWGVCGGYQMLGETLLDEFGAESGACETVKGLGLLPMDTVFEIEKTRTRVKGRFQEMPGCFQTLSGLEFEGYEIHMGKTSIHEGCTPLAFVEEYQAASSMRKEDGLIMDHVAGTYVHGIFDQEGVAAEILKVLMKRKGLEGISLETEDYKAYKERQFKSLEAGLRQHLNMEQIYRILEEGV